MRHAGGKGLLVRLHCTSLWGAGVAKTIRRGRVQTVLHGGGEAGGTGARAPGPQGPYCLGSTHKGGSRRLLLPLPSLRPHIAHSIPSHVPAAWNQTSVQLEVGQPSFVVVGQSRCC